MKKSKLSTYNTHTHTAHRTAIINCIKKNWALLCSYMRRTHATFNSSTQYAKRYSQYYNITTYEKQNKKKKITSQFGESSHSPLPLLLLFAHQLYQFALWGPINVWSLQYCIIVILNTPYVTDCLAPRFVAVAIVAAVVSTSVIRNHTHVQIYISYIYLFSYIYELFELDL